MKSSKMMPSSRFHLLIFDSLLFVMLFLYYFYRIDAKLFYQAQTPVFFWDGDFFREMLVYPGGFIELFSQFLGQFFYYSWTAALLIAILLMVVPWLTRSILKKVSGNVTPIFLSLLPLLPLVFLYHNYDFNISMLVGLIFSLLMFILYLAIAPEKVVFRIVFFPLFFALLYWITAGPAFLFALLVSIDEIFMRRRWLPPILYLALAALLPLLGSRWLFILAKENIYLLNTGFLARPTSVWPVYVLWTVIPAVIIAAFFYKKIAVGVNSKKTFYAKSLQAGLTGICVQGFLFFILFGVILQISFRPLNKKLLLLDYYARHRQWNNVLELAKLGLPETNIVQFQINRALYFTNQLNDAIFYFSQNSGKDGLFVHQDVRPLYPLQFSDIFYDLSLINEAQHWAHEALSVNGDNPWILQRLAQVYILKGEYAAARKCLLMLEKTMWFRNWAREYLDNLDHKKLPWPEELQQKKQLMPVDDFLFTPSEPELVLEELVKANPQNRMAFEYFLAYCLLDGKVGKMMKYIHYLSDLNYQRIPRHVEEAMLLYFVNSEKKDAELPDLMLSKTTYEQFQEIMALMAKVKGDKNAAFHDFQKFKNSFWYYSTYIYRKDRGE